MSKFKFDPYIRAIKEAYASEVLARQDSDNPADWLEIGRVYADGIGVEWDEGIAAQWYRKAANAGSIDAMLRLSFVLNRKWSSEEEKAESIQWARQAADHGSARGMSYLGTAYRVGWNTPIDLAKSFEWYVKAYEAGEVFSAFCAGVVLAQNKNQHNEAVKWMLLATSHEQCPLYLYHLALIYEDIHSPAFQPTKAYQCWDELTQYDEERFRFPAMLAMANCFRNGIGTTPNRKEAIKWLDRLLTVAPKEKKEYRRARKLRQEINGELI